MTHLAILISQSILIVFWAIVGDVDVEGEIPGPRTTHPLQGLVLTVCSPLVLINKRISLPTIGSQVMRACSICSGLPLHRLPEHALKGRLAYQLVLLLLYRCSNTILIILLFLISREAPRVTAGTRAASHLLRHVRISCLTLIPIVLLEQLDHFVQVINIQHSRQVHDSHAHFLVILLTRRILIWRGRLIE